MNEETLNLLDETQVGRYVCEKKSTPLDTRQMLMVMVFI